jgi:ribosome-associated protein
MLDINDRVKISYDEFQWSFVRSGGPGGQNVNKVASKAVLRWDLASTPSLPDDVKARLRAQQRRRVTAEGEVVISSQRYRDQERNREDCLEKLRLMVLAALAAPKPRKATRPTRGSQQRRLQTKRRRSTVKKSRKAPTDE